MSSTIGHHQLDTNSDFNRSPFTSKPDDICSNTTHEASINIPIPSPRQDGGPLTFKPTTDAYSYQDDGRVGDHQRRPAHKYEEIELDEDCHFDERLHCFNGLVPLDHVVIAVNTIVMIGSLSGITLSCIRINYGSRAMIGVSSLRHFLVSSTLLLPIFSLLLGCLLFMCGSVGLFISTRPSAPRVGFDVVYHSTILLCSLLSATQFGGSIIASNMLMKDKFVYTRETWTTMIHTHPHFYCALEQRLKCTDSVCVNPNEAKSGSVERFSICPGIFCVDFCRVNPDVPINGSSVHPMCRPCRRRNGKLRSFFGQCRQFEIDVASSFDHGSDHDQSETNYTNVSNEMCLKSAGRDLYIAGLVAILTSTVYLGCVSVLNFVICYKLCYL